MMEARCVEEYGQCGGSKHSHHEQIHGTCCPPFQCFRQSRFYSQCGSACPRSASPPWDCATTTPPSIAVLIGRWGGWPPWMPLLLRTLATNPAINFFLLSDSPPLQTLPSNVAFQNCPLSALLDRLRRTVGCRLRSLSSSGTFNSGVSAAKVNDLKPMWGEAFSEDLLHGFEWWGYLQECRQRERC